MSMLRSREAHCAAVQVRMNTSVVCTGMLAPDALLRVVTSGGLDAFVTESEFATPGAGESATMLAVARKAINGSLVLAVTVPGRSAASALVPSRLLGKEEDPSDGVGVALLIAFAKEDVQSSFSFALTAASSK